MSSVSIRNGERRMAAAKIASFLGTAVMVSGLVYFSSGREHARELPAAPEYATIEDVRSRMEGMSEGQLIARLAHGGLLTYDMALEHDVANPMLESRGRKAVPALLEALAEDRSPEVRECVAGILGRIGDPSALAGLRAAARGDASETVRKASATAVSEVEAR